MKELFDTKPYIETRTCNMCKYFYRKYQGEKSWGKCELGKSKYDCPAKHVICVSFKAKEG